MDNSLCHYDIIKVNNIKKEILLKGAVLGTEFALYIIGSIAIGYLIGRQISSTATVIGMFIGAILGLLMAIRRAIKIAG